MATHLKRLALGVVALVTLGAGTAGAQSSSTFASPVSAPAGQPIWVRSITPCPAPTAAAYSWVEARVIDAREHVEDNIVSGAVRDDGHWDVTLNAPGGPNGGATGRYLIEVQCGVTSRDTEAVATPTITRTYQTRELEVTSGAAGSRGWLDGPVGGPATTTTTTSTTVPEEAAADEAGDLEVPGGASAAAVSEDEELTAASVSSTGSSTDEIRAEMAKRATSDDDTYVPQAEDDGVPLYASPASAARTAGSGGGGIPAWSFVCAAMLAVGAVLAWGQRRSAPAELEIGE